MNKLITVIVPCYNEENYISKFIDSILLQDYNKENIEILIIDGLSSDNTRNIINNYINHHNNIVLIDNPERTVPYAMNYGINQAKGEILIRMDAHSIYPKDYISKLVYWLNKLNADNVGGVWDSIPANDSLEAQAVAFATSHPFGIGNAQYRISNKTEPYKVDTVPFGCYKSDVFKKIGLFDLQLTRNQDDELNARLIQNGGKIYLIPDLRIKYFARESFSKMYKMFYQYGYFKPLVNLKLRIPATFRQFIPPLFVLFILVGVVISVIKPILTILFLCGVGLYMSINILVSYNISKEKKNIKLFFYLQKSFFLIHYSYGLGYLKGMFDFFIMKKHKRNLIVKSSR